MRINKHIKQLIMLLALLLTVFVGMAVPFTSYAEEPEQKTVRVGWFDSSFYYWDQSGRRCGIAYEYEHKAEYVCHRSADKRKFLHSLSEVGCIAVETYVEHVDAVSRIFSL